MPRTRQHPHPHFVGFPQVDPYVMAMWEGNWNSFDALLNYPHQREEMREMNTNWFMLLWRLLFILYPIERSTFVENRLTFLQEANWKSFSNLLRLHHIRPDTKLNEHGHSFLHAAILAGLGELAKELVNWMPVADLELMLQGGHTALATAIGAGMGEVVVLMVIKNPNLVTIRDENGLLPVALAARSKNKEMTRFLFLQTPTLNSETQQAITALLIDTLSSDMYDTSIDLLYLYPALVFITDIYGRRVLSVLAKKPSASSSYKSKKKSIEEQVKVHEILKIVCRQVARLDTAELTRQRVYEAIIYGSKYGNVEFLTEIFKCNYHLQCATRDEIKRDIYCNAITYRHENVYNLMHKMKNKSILLKPGIDGDGNNVLHQAGLFTQGYLSKKKSIVILQMQTAIQWYEEVEKCVPPGFKDELNHHGKTPRDLFEEEHHELVKDGEKWMKETAQICMFVTSIIAAAMLTALFAVPGGINSESVKPVYLHSRHFFWFMAMDILSVFFSITSLIIFLAILTSRYTSQDFLVSLPRKLMFGLVTLLVSVATFLGAFFGGAVLALGDHLYDHALLPLSLLPGILYIWMQFPLIHKLASSTFGPSIFLGEENLKCYGDED